MALVAQLSSQGEKVKPSLHLIEQHVLLRLMGSSDEISTLFKHWHHKKESNQLHGPAAVPLRKVFLISLG